MILVFLLLGLVVLNLTAYYWAADTTDGVDSAEWERRRIWRGSGGG